MSVDFKDYYKILGVDRKATAGEIKKAFRNLARKFHPDVAKDKIEAEGKFREINEANEVLSDPDKRLKYDELGADWNQPERQTAQQEGRFDGNPGEASEFNFDGTGFSSFFEQVFGGHGRSSDGSFHFSRAGERGTGGDMVAQHGYDIESDILVTLDEVLHGSTRMIRMQCNDPCSGQSGTQTLRVKIPPGVREAQLIRLAGKGQKGMGGGMSGNLYLKVVFAKNPDFRVRDADLYYDLVLSPWEAVLGINVHIPTLEGAVSLKVPVGTKAERRFRLRGKGLPMAGGTRGNLFAIVSIHVPSDLTAEEKNLWESLAAISKFNPRRTS